MHSAMLKFDAACSLPTSWSAIRVSQLFLWNLLSKAASA